LTLPVKNDINNTEIFNLKKFVKGKRV